MSGHRSEKKHTPKYAWVADLLSLGMQPDVKEIDRYATDLEGQTLERKYVEMYKKSGCDLFNKMLTDEPYLILPESFIERVKNGEPVKILLTEYSIDCTYQTVLDLLTKAGVAYTDHRGSNKTYQYISPM